MEVYTRNKIRVTDTYYGYSTSVNDMDIRGILEHSPNIPKGIIFVFSVVCNGFLTSANSSKTLLIIFNGLSVNYFALLRLW